jgi:hypothetical protein
MTTEELRAKIEQPIAMLHWGQERVCTPRLVDEVFGDGKVLLRLYPLNTRPNHYFVRVDTTWDEEMIGEELNPMYMHEVMDSVCEAIEEQFGSALCGWCGGRYGCNKGSVCEGCADSTEEWSEFPALDDSCGSAWELHKWEWFTEKENGKAID